MLLLTCAQFFSAAWCEQQLFPSCVGHLLFPGFQEYPMAFLNFQIFRDLLAMQQMQGQGCVFPRGAQFFQDSFLYVRKGIKYQKCHSLDLFVYDGYYSVAKPRS